MSFSHNIARLVLTKIDEDHVGLVLLVPEVKEYDGDCGSFDEFAR